MKDKRRESGRLVKLAIAFFLFYSGILHLLIMLSKKLRKDHRAVVLFYHRFKIGNAFTYPPKLCVRTFESNMRHLKRWYTVLPLDQLIQRLQRQENFESPAVAITIDDGFRDNYDIAYPVLKELQTPAAIFLTSGMISTTRKLWIDELAAAFLHTQLACLQLPDLFGDEVLSLSSRTEKAQACRRVFNILLVFPNEARVTLIDSLTRTLNSHETSPNPSERTMLSWDEVREMHHDNFLFGAHTMTHPILSRMPEQEARYEIAQSKRIIEEELGVPIKHFAIPNGRDQDFTEALREFCKEIGFESVLTTNPGIISRNTDPYALPRIDFSGPTFLFAVRLARSLLWFREDVS